MTPIEIILILGLVGYAIYRQSQQHEVVGHTRFKMAVIYGVVGLAAGGFARPNDAGEVGLLLTGLALSILVGVARGRLTHVWADGKGHVYARGTAPTIMLFIGMVVVKFGLGTVAYFYGVSDDGGFGEILVMIALMIAFQAEIIWRRAQPLGARSTSDSTTAARA